MHAPPWTASAPHLGGVLEPDRPVCGLPHARGAPCRRGRLQHRREAFLHRRPHRPLAGLHLAGGASCCQPAVASTWQGGKLLSASGGLHLAGGQVAVSQRWPPPGRGASCSRCGSYLHWQMGPVATAAVAAQPRTRLPAAVSTGAHAHPCQTQPFWPWSPVEAGYSLRAELPQAPTAPYTPHA
jgi:hypothetical protein